jgi:predicted enzyme related to lactoylglutathione lyase
MNRTVVGTGCNSNVSEYRLRAVRVFTSDFGRAREFYSDVLGMTPEGVSETEGYAVFAAGEAVLIVEAMDPSDSEASDLIGRFVGASLAVDDIQRVYETLSCAVRIGIVACDLKRA